MSRKKSKYKINTNNKSYLHHESPLYKITTKKKLAALLNISASELRTAQVDLGNYKIFDIEGKSGKPRTIQQPIDLQDKIHTRIASLLCRISQPNYVHSGLKGHSHLTNAKQHQNSKKVLVTDIKSFFPSTKKEMIFHFFNGLMKCNPDVARALSNICCCNGHIPTGSRLSMPMALWANIHMFKELEALSKCLDIEMTLYVDDLTFSGDNVNNHFKSIVGKIITKHNHVMHPTKTMLYAKDAAKLITGVVVKNGNLLVRNEQHKKLYQDMVLWEACRDEPIIAESIKTKLIGRLNSLSCIHSKYKDKARSIKAYKPELKS